MVATNEQSCLVLKSQTPQDLALEISKCDDRWKLFRIFSPADHGKNVAGDVWTAFMVSKTRLLSVAT